MAKNIYIFFCENSSPLKQQQKTHLFLQSHNLEPLKVGKISSPISLFLLLGERAVGPFGIDLLLLPELLDGSGTSRAGEFRDGERCEGDVGEGEGMSRNNFVLLTGRTIDQDL